MWEGGDCLEHGEAPPPVLLLQGVGSGEGATAVSGERPNKDGRVLR